MAPGAEHKGRSEERLQVITLGEALAVMDPILAGPLRSVGAFEKRVGGAELNVAAALARLGHHAGWTGKLGSDELGAEILSFLRGENVDVSRAVLDPGAPTGVYFKERRALGKLRVHYYRAGSAASRLCFEELDLDYLLSCEILHLTGITAALSEDCLELTERLMEAANERGVTVSFDANVRWRLFGERDPKEVLDPLIARADLLFLSDEEAQALLGGKDPDSVQKSLKNLRTEIAVVHDSDGALAVSNTGSLWKAAHPVEVVDTVGAGDAFVAGFLSGRLRGWDTGKALDMANACGACAVTIPGDARSMPAEEDALSLVHDVTAAER